MNGQFFPVLHENLHDTHQEPLRKSTAQARLVNLARGRAKVEKTRRENAPSWRTSRQPSLAAPTLIALLTVLVAIQIAFLPAL